MFLDPYLYLYACGSFSNGVFISLRGPVIPELARRVGKPSAALGAYLGIGGLSGGAFALPTGALLDRYDAHAVFAFGTLLRAVSVGATPLCSALWQVNLLAIVQGATLPLIGVSIRVCLVRAVGQEKCAQALNFTMGAFGLASIVTPLAYAGLQSAFGPERGFESVFVVVAVAYAALAFATLAGFETPPVDDDGDTREEEEAFVVEEQDDDDDEEGSRSHPPRGDIARDDPASVWASGRDSERAARLESSAFRDVDVYVPATADEESRGVAPLHGADEDDGEEDRDGPRIPRKAPGTTTSAKGAARRRPPMDVLVPMTLYMCLSVASEVTYGSWIYTLATERSGFSDKSAASLTSAFWAAFTATRFFLSFVRAGPLVAVAFSHAVAFLATAFLSLQWGGIVLCDGSRGALRDAASPASRVLLWVVTLCVGCGAAGMFPNGIALGRTLFPLDGFAQAAFELGASVGSGIGPYVAARVYESLGDSAAIPATCAASGAGAVAALVVALRRKKREEPNASRRLRSRLAGENAQQTVSTAATTQTSEPPSSYSVLTRPLLSRGTRLAPEGDDD
jgi:FHS family Na+ dependent glucose MFS transporter 1